MQIDERKRLILGVIVDEYIRQASRLVPRRCSVVSA